MRIGLDNYTIGFMNLNPYETLDFAQGFGMEGVQFGSVTQLSPKWDEGEIQDVKRYADEKGMYLEVNIPSVNPWRVRERYGFVRMLERHIRFAALAGSKTLRTYIGWRDDRYNPETPWRRQLEDSVKVLRMLAPLARELGVKFALETHMDATTSELLWVIEQVGEDVVGICLDTGNLTVRMEDPVFAVNRIAHLVVATHMKDSILFFGENGLRWQARPCGQGVIPLGEIISTVVVFNPDLNLSIEDHPRIYDLPIFDPDWLSSHRDLTPVEFSKVIRLALESERKIRDGEIRSPEEEEAIPWEERVEERLRITIAHLRSILKEAVS
jgi:sugar phosphate isomerase/epimerase